MSRKRTLSVLVTVLFTDIVGSTEIAAELGDKRWRDLVRRHHAIVRRELKRFRGRELDTAGDGFFARFDRPADAIRCACAISDGVREVGIEIRAGIHVGEAEVFEHKVGGIAVNVAARVIGVAKGGEVLVSSTLRDAVAGSGFAFADHGIHRLKGIEGEWRLFEVTSMDGERRSLPLSEEEARTRRGFTEAVPVGRRWGLVAAVTILVVALIGGGIAFSGGDGDAADTKTIDSPPYRALLAKVPGPFRSTCEVAASAPGNALASVECRPTEMYEVTYSSFASVEEMQVPFEGFSSPADLTNLDCSRAPSARGEYTIFGRRAGEVACFVREGTGLSTSDSVIAWTDEELLVLGQAVRGDAADLTLYEWWRNEAGPWGSSAQLQKDGEPSDLLEGVFRAVGHPWTLTFEGGRYEESQFGPIYGDAEVFFAKPSRVLLYHRLAPQTFSGHCPNYEEYRWRLRDERLDLVLVSGGCREYSSDDIANAEWRWVR
jgi:class 3 adenylate cyclase